jgi:hypothetical protein
VFGTNSYLFFHIFEEQGHPVILRLPHLVERREGL